MSITIRFENAAAIQQGLRELGNQPAMRRAIKDALRDAAVPMAELARSLAPIDEGDLKRSIKIAPRKRRRGDDVDRFGVVIGIDANEEPALIKARRRRRDGGKGGDYRDPGVAGVGPITEFGRPGVAAKPFMRPAFDAEGEKTIQRFGQTAGPAIEKQAAQIARKAARRAKKRGAG